MNPRPVDHKSNALPVAPSRHLPSYYVTIVTGIFAANYSNCEEFYIFAASDQDVEYELEEVWDGAKWHVVHKLVPKKTDTGKFVLIFIHFAITSLFGYNYRSTDLTEACDL